MEHEDQQQVGGDGEFVEQSPDAGSDGQSQGTGGDFSEQSQRAFKRPAQAGGWLDDVFQPGDEGPSGQY